MRDIDFEDDRINTGEPEGVSPRITHRTLIPSGG
jgi:hypothetical protein